ncbi:hypothetical protein [Halorubrum salipaludis]|nr:hypothetical protein [Halorubrum salipaludis]
MGTGAFTSVEADRQVDIDVRDDTEAYLALQPVDANGDPIDDPENGSRTPLAQDDPFALVNEDTGRLDLNVTALNVDAVTTIPNLFQVSNLGRNEVDIHFEKSFEGDGDGNPDAVSFYRGQDDPETDAPLDDENNGITLEDGNSFVVDLVATTDGVTPGEGIIDTLTIVGVDVNRGDNA